MSGAYTSEVPVHDVDLNVPEADRWAEAIRRDRVVASRVAREALADIPAAHIAGAALRAVYGLFGGRYEDEIGAWAAALGLSRGRTTLVQCSYELSQLSGRLFGCTAGVVRSSRTGALVHVRSMDWPLQSIGAATRLVRFHRGRRGFVAVGIAGFVGVLSGMVPGAYSVTMNWAPPSELPGFDFGPAFLLREVLETCDTYEEAVRDLRNTRLACPVFFVVCGAKDGQACVVERTRKIAEVRRLRSSVLVQANHHVTRRLQERNEYFRDGLEDSRERARVLELELLRRADVGSLDTIAGSLDAEPVCNDDSHQQMLFCPRTGEFAIWRRRAAR